MQIIPRNPDTEPAFGTTMDFCAAASTLNAFKEHDSSEESSAKMHMVVPQPIYDDLVQARPTLNTAACTGTK